MKKVVRAVCLGLAALVLFAACAPEDSKTPVVTMLLLGNRPVNDRLKNALVEVNKLLKEQVNARLKVEFIEWASWQNQYQLAVASGNSGLDLVVTASDWLFAWELVRKGGFMPLTEDMLKTNAPLTWAAVPASHWEACSKDGNIWFIPEDQYTQYTVHGMMWRKDWAEEGGIGQVDDFNGLEAYFDAVKKNHPEAFPWDVNGAKSDPQELINGYFVSNSNVQLMTGVSIGNNALFYYDKSDPYTVVSPFMDSDLFFDAARMFDRWSKKGFWREDVLNYEGDTRELMYAGLSGAEQHHAQTYYSSARTQMDLKQPGSELQFFYFGKGNKNVRHDLITHGAMAVNAASKHPDKALQVYDLLRNDRRIYTLYNYGIEGVDYIVNADGIWKRPDAYDDSVDAIGSNFWAGRMDEFEPRWETQWPGRGALIEELNAIAEYYPYEQFSFDNTKVAAEIAALADVCSMYVKGIQFGKAGDPVKAVQDFRAALRASGYDKVKAELQAQLDALKAESGK